MSIISRAPFVTSNYLKLLSLLCLLLPTPVVLAGEYQSLIQPRQGANNVSEPKDPADADSSKGQSYLSNQSTLPNKPAAIDSQGRPIAIPQAAQPAMEFSGSDYIENAQKLGRTDSRRPKWRLASAEGPRPLVADDPSCRWLDNRMGQLEKLLASRGRGDHHDDELKARQKEWRCLRCGTEGPRQGDHDRCMYRR